MPWMPVTLADSVSTKLVGSVLMLGHWMPIESIWIGSQLGQLKLSPVARADRERDAEALACPERAVAEEGEARGRAGDGHAADAHGRARRAEADERVVRAGAGVDLEVRCGQLQERPEVDRQLVCAEDERLEAVAVELERRGDGDAVVVAVGDRPVDGLARQELHAARLDGDRAGAADAGAERDVPVHHRHAEVVEAHRQVVEDEEVEEVDPAGRRDVDACRVDREAVGEDAQAGEVGADPGEGRERDRARWRR